jgi:hypothetical protein
MYKCRNIQMIMKQVVRTLQSAYGVFNRRKYLYTRRLHCQLDPALLG